MFHLVYASSASQPFTGPDLQAGLQKSRQKDAKLSVTEMLLYKGWQLLRSDHDGLELHSLAWG
jgi:hypothetical protein